jgi:hypothetical protein
MFIPQPKKANYTEAMAYWPNKSTILHTENMYKLVHWHIRDKSLGLRPLNWYQFSYQPWETPETALHHGTTPIEKY